LPSASAYPSAYPNSRFRFVRLPLRGPTRSPLRTRHPFYHSPLRYARGRSHRRAERCRRRSPAARRRRGRPRSNARRARPSRSRSARADRGLRRSSRRARATTHRRRSSLFISAMAAATPDFFATALTRSRSVPARRRSRPRYCP